MTDKDDVMIGMAVAFGATAATFGAWSMLEPYAVSLSRSGFAGRKVMFIQNLSSESVLNLKTLGFDLIEFTDYVKDLDHWWYIKTLLAKRYFEDNKHTRYAMVLDCRDQVVQTNISSWLEKNLAPHKLVACSECVPISFGRPNTQWITETFGRQEWLDSYPVLCGGTYGGESASLLALLEALCGILQHEKTNDQAALNYFCRVSPFKEIVKVPRMSEGFTCTCCQIAVPYSLERNRSVLMDEEPVFRDGLVYPKGGDTPFCLVHQYDLNGGWNSAIRSKYRL